MEARKAETLYLQGRVSASLAMAAGAAGPCARMAHLTLARLYGEAIDTLVARPALPTFHSLFAAAGERAISDHSAVAVIARPMILALAQDKRQRASALR